MIVAGLVACVALTWGVTYVVLRIGMQHSPPFFFAGVRVLLGGLLIIAIAAILRRAWPTRPRAHLLLALGGLLNYSVFYGGLNYGVTYLPAGETALLNYTAPFWIAGLAWVVLHQPLGFRRMAGLVSGFLGVVLVVADRLAFGSDPLWAAHGAVLLAAISWGAGSVYFVRWLRPVALEWAVGLQSLYGSLPLFAIWVLGERAQPPDGTWTFWATLGFTVLLSSFLAQLAFFSLLRRRDATVVGTYMFLVPVVAALAGFIFLSEPITLITAMGGTSVVLGIYLVNRPESSPTGNRASLQQESVEG